MKSVVETSNAPGAIGPYSQAICFGNMIFVSGQLPINPLTGTMPDTIKEQTAQSLKNAEGILKAAGSSMDKVLKTTVFLSDIHNFNAMNEVYATFFPSGGYPARSAVEVANLPKNALVEIELTASK